MRLAPARDCWPALLKSPAPCSLTNRSILSSEKAVRAMHALRSSTRGQIKGLGQHSQAWRSLCALTLDTTYADLSCHSPQQGSTHTSPPPGWHTGDTRKPQRTQLTSRLAARDSALGTPHQAHIRHTTPSGETYPAGEEALHALAVEVALEPHHQPHPGLRQLIRRQGDLVPLNTVPAVSDAHIWAAPWPAQLGSGAPDPPKCAAYQPCSPPGYM